MGQTPLTTLPRVRLLWGVALTAKEMGSIYLPLEEALAGQDVTDTDSELERYSEAWFAYDRFGFESPTPGTSYLGLIAWDEIPGYAAVMNARRLQENIESVVSGGGMAQVDWNSEPPFGRLNLFAMTDAQRSRVWRAGVWDATQAQLKAIRKDRELEPETTELQNARAKATYDGYARIAQIWMEKTPQWHTIQMELVPVY